MCNELQPSRIVRLAEQPDYPTEDLRGSGSGVLAYRPWFLLLAIAIVVQLREDRPVRSPRVLARWPMPAIILHFSAIRHLHEIAATQKRRSIPAATRCDTTDLRYSRLLRYCELSRARLNSGSVVPKTESDGGERGLIHRA